MPLNGRPMASTAWGVMVELMVPQAATTSFTWWRRMNRISCMAYFWMVSRLLEP